MRHPCLAAALCLLAPLAAHAQQGAENRLQVWSQVVAYPQVFSAEPDFQNHTQDGFFIAEHVAAAETVNGWTQMQTLTGHRDVGAGRDAAAVAQMAEAIAVNFLDGYRAACAVEVDALPMPVSATPGARAAFGAYMGCANVRGQGHSEEMVVLVLVGAQDSYTLQWAERGAARPAFAREEFARWQPRLDRLARARLCTVPAGEAAPYPSCN